VVQNLRFTCATEKYDTTLCTPLSSYKLRRVLIKRTGFRIHSAHKKLVKKPTNLKLYLGNREVRSHLLHPQPRVLQRAHDGLERFEHGRQEARLSRVELEAVDRKVGLQLLQPSDEPPDGLGVGDVQSDGRAGLPPAEEAGLEALGHLVSRDEVAPGTKKGSLSIRV
jgi:hypothetical protein